MFKQFLKNWLLLEERLELERASARVQAQFTEHAKSEKEAKERFKASFDVKDYLLKQFAVFDVKLLEKRNVYIDQKTGRATFDDDIVDAAKKAGIPEDMLYTEGAAIAKNEVFRFMIEFLMSRQILLTVLSAPNEKASDFGRAHIAAYAHTRGEFERLQSIKEEREKPAPAFDDTAAL